LFIICIAEHNILHTAREALNRTAGIELRIRATPLRERRQADATLDFLIDGDKHRFRPEVRTADRFAMPALIKTHADKSRQPVLLVAPCISRQIAERRREL
jgi:hypothetical protein